MAMASVSAKRTTQAVDLLDEDHVDIVFEKQMDTNTELGRFDEIIGKLEDFMMDEDFLSTQGDFFEKYYRAFEDDDENKLIYTDIFNEYVEMIDNLIMKRLKKELPWFDINHLLKQITERPELADTEIFEMLLTIGDFTSFKQLVLDYKHDKEGKYADLDDIIMIS